jgi:general secretion pathway protein G
MKRSAFTMMELIFVIVVIGILAGIAVPRLAATRTDARISKGKADVAAIRSSIAMVRSQNLLKGENAFPDPNSTSTDLFRNILDYPIKASESGWSMVGNDQLKYSLNIGGIVITFDYDQNNRGTFTCVGAAENSGADKEKLCNTLTQ